MASIKTWLIPKDQGAEYRRDIAFAHIEIDLRNRLDQNIWESVLDSACRQSETSVWAIGPDTQTYVATLAWNQVNSHEDMIKSIESDLKEETEQQIVVCFSPWDWIQDLPWKNNQGFSIRPAKDDSLEDRLKYFDRMPPKNVLCYEPKQVERENYEPYVQREGCNMLHLPPGYRHPFPLAEFEQIHLCLTTFREQTIFDPYTEQMARIRFLTSEEERREQVALAFRTSNVPLRVAMYCDQGTIDHFVEFGASERRLRIHNSHAPGFLLALVCIKDWEIDIGKIISCFFSSAQQYFILRPVRYNLYMQGVTRYIPKGRSDEDISGAEKGFFQLLGTALHERTSIVQKLLPVFDFDHRLAVFVARPTHSAKVLKVKLQLAAILVTGIERLFSFAPRGNMPSEEYKSSLVNTCQGWTCLLSHTGSMWLAVGLWKDGTAAVERLDKSAGQPNEIEILGTPVTMNNAAFHDVQRTLTSWTNACALSYIPVLPDSLPETGGLSESESDEIREHLAWAYLHQVVQTKRALNGEMFHRLLNGTHDIYSITLPPWTFDESDFDTLLADDIPHYNDGSHDDRIFGIFHGMSREFAMSNFYLDDWTYIPGYIIRKAHDNSQYYDLEDLTGYCPRDSEEQKALSGLPE
ncbi:hypothetical protein FANTH_6490 [Fusarium anthophilum]|uniref:Uncharacterized protein n=1 Tax=Fusarium anthophilum TaxID=48485 RepID=A0A8H5E4R9_9HYPO|nr:hypothetical protein FANTH_6490 [Fusarium anthophilum]